jgi:hypothetical protein
MKNINEPQALRGLSDDEIVCSAHRDGMETIAKIIPYLRERRESADRYIKGTYSEPTKRMLVEHIQHCNKAIGLILGIITE